MPSSKILNESQTNQNSLVDLTGSLSLSESTVESKKEKLNRRFCSPGAEHCWYWNAQSMSKIGKGKGFFTIPKLHYGTLKGPNENSFLKKGTKVDIFDGEDVSHATIAKIFFRIKTKQKKDVPRSKIINNMALWLDLKWIEEGKTVPEKYLVPIGSLQDFTNES